MTDSRQKGARAENQAKQVLSSHTGLNWQRVPSSGALNEQHGLKGDLYVPDAKNIYCVEVKHYKEDQLTSKLLTSKSPTVMKWWEQTVRQAEQVGREPLLLFKFDRSKWFVCAQVELKDVDRSDIDYFIFYNRDRDEQLMISMLEDWLKLKRKFVIE